MPKPRKNESKQDYLKRCTSEVIAEGNSADQAYAMCNAYWDEARSTKAQRQPITLSGAVSFIREHSVSAAENAESDDIAGFHMTAYTGQVLDMGLWGRYVFDVSGMKAKSKIPILREHQRDRVVGWSKKAWAEGQNFLISGQFSESTADAREVMSLAKEGYPWQSSVGISPVKIKRLEGEKETMKVNGITVSGPIEVWLESKVGEVSFVSLGADDETAAIAMTDQSKTITCSVLHPEKEGEMTLEEFKDRHQDLYQQIFELGVKSIQIPDIELARKEGARAELERIKSVRAQMLPGHEALIEAMVEDGVTTGEQAAIRILQAERQLRTAAAANLATDAAAVPEVPVTTPPAIEAALEQDLTSESGMQQAWDRDPAIREEFGRFEIFKAYQENKHLAKVR